MPDITPAAFISYSREDSEFALRLAKSLKEAGANVWLDQLDIKPGQLWDDAIEQALDSADAMLFILSPASVKSKNVRDEMAYGLNRDMVIIPLVYRECIVPLQLQRNNRIDFRSDYDRGVAALIGHLKVAQPDTASLQNDVLYQLSITDDCTGLFNSRHFYTLLEDEIAFEQPAEDDCAASVRPGTRRIFSLVFIDLDHFGRVNDSYGHLVGSRLLAEFGDLIKRTLGPDHAAFRYGGDEFLALLRGLDKPAATDVAQRLHHTLSEQRFLADHGLSLSITASFGLVTFPEDGDTLHSIVRSADAMMYRAKAQGRDRIVVADSAHPFTMTIAKTARHDE